MRHVGVSNVSVEQLRLARGIVEVVWVQNRYNLTDRASQPVLEACAREGLAFIPWFPLATGKLAGEAIERVARRRALTPMQVGLALLQRSSVMEPPRLGWVATATPRRVLCQVAQPPIG